MTDLFQNILIVDDDADIRATLSSLLELENYKVFTCANAADSLKQLKKMSCSTIIIDIYLPDANGIELIKDIRALGIETPVIVITGSSELDLARNALRLGVFDYLVKPFKHKQLQQVVHNAVIKNNLQEEKESLDHQKRLYQIELEKMVQRKVSELKESELKYMKLVEQSLAGVFIIQDDFFRYANKKLEQIFDCPLDEMIDKKSLFDFSEIEQHHILKTHLSRFSREEYTGGSFILEARTKSGSEKFLEIWAGFVQYRGKSAIEGIVLDITEQQKLKIRERQLELEILNEHKLAAIGQLAAGISHNLNTPISVIQGNAELLQLQHPEFPEIPKILAQTARMTDLIQTIILKGKKEQETKVVPIDLNELLNHELEFLNANLFFKHHVIKECFFEDDLPLINGVYSDFSQSIYNIIQNAIDAVYDSDTRKITITSRIDDQHILISVQDSGCGIETANKSKIFTPFFTTKAARLEDDAKPNAPKGTGLGLSLVYNLLSPYGVKIDFDSEVGTGTTFLLKIPHPNTSQS